MGIQELQIIWASIFWSILFRYNRNTVSSYSFPANLHFIKKPSIWHFNWVASRVVGNVRKKINPVLPDDQINRIKIDENFYATEQKWKIIYDGGKHGRNLESPPRSPMKECSATFSEGGRLKTFAVSIPIFHHNNLQFPVFITLNNNSGTLLEK